MDTSNMRLLALLCGVTAAHGWWCEGHMLVAEIASLHVTADVNAKAAEYANYIHFNGTFKKSPDWKQMACWADDMKGAISLTAPWHFIDQPVNPENVPNVPNPPVDNVVKAMESEERTLRERSKYNIWENSFSFADFIHFVGDSHQPLHCAELFSHLFPPPTGDMGGNLFIVVFNGTSTKLHSFWDSVGELYQDQDRPMTPTEQQDFVALAKSLDAEYGPQLTPQEINNVNYTSWAVDSHSLAIKYAYADLKNGSTLTPVYINNARNVAKRQITLAGRRLAVLLQKLFG